MFRRPIRIGNCSGIINDGIDQIYRLAKHGQVDAITADYLAEFNIAWKAIELQTDPTLGYEPNFLEQIAWHNGDAARLVAEKRIKIVHDGGALNPRGLVEKTDAYLQSIGIHNLKVAWFRIFAQGTRAEAFDDFKRAVFYNGPQGFCGFHAGDDWDARYQIERCEFVNLQAVHFVIKGILQDGVSSSNVLDGFAKSMGEFVRARVIEMPTELVQKEAERNVSGSCRPAKIAAGYKYPPIKCSYNRRDVLLFANPIGVPKDSLHFLYELHPAFAAFPTFPINLAFKQTDQDIFDFIARTTTGGVPGVPPFDAQRSVDGERAITVLRQLPVSSDGLDVEVRGRVIGVYDKGGAMILEAEQTLVDANTGVEYTKMASTAFGISQDGYGGPRRPTKSAVSIPATTPDAVHVYYTTETTALLYRLCGDYNPMHADEEFGKRAGFQGSILHGLGTWNMAAQGLLREMGGSDPRRFKSFGARFKSVVYPGDTLVTRMWRVGNEGNFDLIVFETVVKEDGRVALSNGFAKILQRDAKL
ncbi:dehydratase NIT22 like protein [Verticillium longisporum]|nr:dehydratase NIT22 like protein [Verticillium longisporum]